MTELPLEFETIAGIPPQLAKNHFGTHTVNGYKICMAAAVENGDI